jgi:hypothetical protein
MNIISITNTGAMLDGTIIVKDESTQKEIFRDDWGFATSFKVQYIKNLNIIEIIHSHEGKVFETNCDRLNFCSIVSLSVFDRF